MAKDAYYFPHDSNARNDEKIISIRMKYGAEGYGIFFMILERLRDEDGYTAIKNYENLAFDLRVDASKIKSVIEDFDLFDFKDDGKHFFSNKFKERMAPLDNMREQRRQAGIKSAEKRAKNQQKHKDSSTAVQNKDNDRCKNEQQVNKSIVDKSIVNENKEEAVASAAEAADFNLEYKNLEKDKKSIVEFIRHKHPNIVKPYVDLWNLFATEKGKGNNIHEVKRITNKVSSLFRDRILDQDFEFLKILEAAKDSDYALKSEKGWFTLEWILSLDKDGDPNYIKVIEGKYKNSDKEENPMNLVLKTKHIPM